MVKGQRKRTANLHVKGALKSRRKAAQPPVRRSAVLPLLTTTVSSTEGGCADSLTLSVRIDRDKIVHLSVKPARTCCPEVKRIAAQVQQHVVGKHIGDVYRITEELFDAQAMPHHSSTFVIHALRQAILDYESKKATASLREAVTMLQEYDKGLPERDLRTDYEY